MRNHALRLQNAQSKGTQQALQGKGCLSGFFFTLSALTLDGEDEKYARKVLSSFTSQISAP